MRAHRLLRRHLAVTTILSVAPFIGYGRQAFAGCDASPATPTIILCSGSSGGENITVNNADVSTEPGFSVISGGDGFLIEAQGSLSFTDTNASTITAVGIGLEVHSTGDDGATASDVTITTNGHITTSSAPSYEEDGIYAVSRGSGSIEITVTGTVDAYDTGIRAYNVSGKDITITTGAGSSVTGGAGGILALNTGSGSTDIAVNGDVTATGMGGGVFGVVVVNSKSTDSLTITTGAQSEVTGYSGVGGSQGGSGDFVIMTRGTVTGTDGYGIYAKNNGRDLTITTEGAVSGKIFAIFAIGNDYGGVRDMTITTHRSVSGVFAGIYAQNQGTGDFEITAHGDVMAIAAGGVGISAGNGASSLVTNGKMKITSEGSITAGYGGIFATNFANSDLDIIVNGDVTVDGFAQYVTGIAAWARGNGAINIKIGAASLVQGRGRGIYGYSKNGQAIHITNDGEVRNLSGEAADIAITTVRGPTTIDNNNLLIGTVRLGALEDTLNNAGRWNVGGYNAQASDFGAGVDTVNNSGIFRAAHDGSAAETTDITNLEYFNNSGVITLVDGLANDTLDLDGLFDFVGQGGTIAVDTFLDPSVGASDLLVLQGNSDGTTNIAVNLTNPIGSSPNTDGIRVMIVDGNTSLEHFQIEGGVLNAGFFAWNLKLEDDTYYLYTTGFGAGSYEFAAGITGAQDIWHQTTGTLLQRQADLRALLAGTQVTPVADFSEPVEPTPVGRVTPGLWFKGVGGYLERDQDVGNNAVTDRNQEIYGLFAGFDFGGESAGEAWMFGLVGGYVTSNLDFTSTNTKWDYEGPSVGAYATYLDHAFYADLTVKADFLDIDIDASGIAPAADDVDSDVFNLGGQIDTGYKVPLEHGLFAEPQASLAVVHTEVDDIDDVMGGAVDFEDEASVRGRLGLRLGHELTASNQLIYSSDVTASVWQEFAGDNDVTIAAPDFPVSDVSDSPSETYGDVALGFSVQSPEGWSSFLRANYQFAEDYDAFAGNAGVRFAW